MTTRNLIIGLLVASLVMTLPAASASEDDPTFSVPDPAPVTTGGVDNAQFTAGDALTTYAVVEQNVVDATDSATSGDPSVPIGNVDNIVDEATGFAGRSVGRASGFQSAAQTWAFGEGQTKVQEAGYTASRTFDSGTAHVTSAGGLARVVLGSICRDSVMGDGCAEDSLVGELVENSATTNETVSGSIGEQQSNVEAFKAHVQSELDLLLCGGPCE